MIESKTTEPNDNNMPEVKMLITKHNIDVKNNEMKNHWTSCCWDLDKRAVQYFTQTGIMICIMSFCIYQLVNVKSIEDQQIYLALLNFLLGILLPSPKFSGA
jgi:hypothetical protein